MKDPKTTVTAVVTVISVIVNALTGTLVPQEALITVGLFFIGLFSKDSSKD